MTMWVLCKDCWLRHDASTLLATCKQCVANTKIERPEPLVTIGGAGPFPRSGPLVCKKHPTEPLDIYCRECRGALSPRSLIGSEGVVALAGDTLSGKTSLLWVISERLRQASASGVYIRAAIGNSDQEMKRAVRSTFSRGQIAPTQPHDADIRNYAWEIVLPSSASTVIAFHDAAGELWSGLATLPRTSYEMFYRYLDLAGSMVFAIDGERLMESIETAANGGVSTPEAREAQTHELAIVDAIARRVRARGVRMPLAAVVTKADRLWQQPAWSLFHPGNGATSEEIHAAVRDLLLAAGRKTLMDAIDDAFSPVHYCAVSAFGHAVVPPLRIEALRPARVEEPLLALLDGRVPPR